MTHGRRGQVQRAVGLVRDPQRDNSAALLVADAEQDDDAGDARQQAQLARHGGLHPDALGRRQVLPCDEVLRQGRIVSEQDA